MPHLGIHASDAFLGKSRRGLLGDVMEEVDDSVGRVRQCHRSGRTRGEHPDHLRLGQRAVDHVSGYRESQQSMVKRAFTWAMHNRSGTAKALPGKVGHRVPGIFCWPGKIAPHSVEQSPVSTLDILPTVFASGRGRHPEGSVDRWPRCQAVPDAGGAYRTKVAEFEFYYSCGGQQAFGGSYRTLEAAYAHLIANRKQ